ncbi:MAG: ATP-binding cassette domain-containing protein [Nitrospiraceae bacterium]|nr:ATP-binding cassette domain-containing protein [Nitrospiraceae bacterium]
MTHTLTAESVAYAYESASPVFSQVDAAVRAGEILGIVGPNGSGKSTLLRVMSGLLRPGSGRVTLDGRPLSAFSNVDRARTLAFLPQAVNPAFALSVFEVVCLGRYPHMGAFGALSAHDREVAERCMRHTEIEALETRDFLTLSGGERQRVLLASILAQEPDILLLDEPTAALDIHHQIELFALLARLAEDGYGFAVVTHDLNLAARFCDRLLLLTNWRETPISGTPAEVLTGPRLSEAYAAAIRVDRHPVTDAPLIWAETPAGNGPSAGGDGPPLEGGRS